MSIVTRPCFHLILLAVAYWPVICGVTCCIYGRITMGKPKKLQPPPGFKFKAIFGALPKAPSDSGTTAAGSNDANSSSPTRVDTQEAKVVVWKPQ